MPTVDQRPNHFSYFICVVLFDLFLVRDFKIPVFSDSNSLTLPIFFGEGYSLWMSPMSLGYDNFGTREHF